MNLSFQKYFSKDDSSPFFCLGQSRTRMPNFKITPNDILIACKEMKNKLSRTPEGIPSFFIKKTIGSLLIPLCYIFNSSLEFNSIPSQWKRAYVAPIFKKGDRQNPTNYRPVRFLWRAVSVAFLRLLFPRKLWSIFLINIWYHLFSLALCLTDPLVVNYWLVWTSGTHPFLIIKLRPSFTRTSAKRLILWIIAF